MKLVAKAGEFQISAATSVLEMSQQKASLTNTFSE